MSATSSNQHTWWSRIMQHTIDLLSERGAIPLTPWVADEAHGLKAEVAKLAAQNEAYACQLQEGPGGAAAADGSAVEREGFRHKERAQKVAQAEKPCVCTEACNFLDAEIRVLESEKARLALVAEGSFQRANLHEEQLGYFKSHMENIGEQAVSDRLGCSSRSGSCLGRANTHPPPGISSDPFAEAERDRLEDKYAILVKEHCLLVAEVDEHRAQAASLASELRSVQTEIVVSEAESERHRLEAGIRAAECESLHAELVQMKALHAAASNLFRAELTEQIAFQDIHRRERDSLHAELIQFQGNHALLSADHEVLSQEVRHLRSECNDHSLLAAIAQLREEYNSLVKQVDSLRCEAEQLRSECADLGAHRRDVTFRAEAERLRIENAAMLKERTFLVAQVEEFRAQAAQETETLVIFKARNEQNAVTASGTPEEDDILPGLSLHTDVLGATFAKHCIAGAHMLAVQVPNHAKDGCEVVKLGPPSEDCGGDSEACASTCESVRSSSGECAQLQVLQNDTLSRSCAGTSSNSIASTSPSVGTRPFEAQPNQFQNVVYESTEAEFTRLMEEAQAARLRRQRGSQVPPHGPNEPMPAHVPAPLPSRRPPAAEGSGPGHPRRSSEGGHYASASHNVRRPSARRLDPARVCRGGSVTIPSSWASSALNVTGLRPVTVAAPKFTAVNL